MLSRANDLSDPRGTVRGMKLLTATRERQGERDGDFCFAVEGELVLLGYVCATDRADPTAAAAAGGPSPG